MIYTIRKWRENKNRTGVVLNASAYDDDNERWKNVKIYVPYTTDDDHPDATTACVKRNEVTGKQLCLIGVKIFDNYLADEKDAKKKDDGKEKGGDKIFDNYLADEKDAKKKDDGKEKGGDKTFDNYLADEKDAKKKDDGKEKGGDKKGKKKREEPDDDDDDDDDDDGNGSFGGRRRDIPF